MGTERFVDLIQKKKNGETLTKEEIDFMITDYVAGKIPDYQMSAMLMAIYFNGMENEELAAFTLAMRDSGDLVDLSPIEGIKVDKHSTGGVGDKTTLIVGPIVAACGVPVAKMSGRGLGFTGGTLDKLESISGFRIDLSAEEFFETVKNGNQRDWTDRKSGTGGQTFVCTPRCNSYSGQYSVDCSVGYEQEAGGRK